MPRKVFTNGSPLPASDLNTYLMDQSVMTFADSAARSAAITSPTEGMITYLNDTNKVEVYTGAAWVDINDNSAAIPKSVVTTTGDLIVANGNASVTRLGIGTNGQVLSSNGSTAVWTTPAGGGWTNLGSTSLSSTQVIVTSIPQTYKILRVEISGASLGNNGSIQIQVRNNTTNLNTDQTYWNGSVPAWQNSFSDPDLYMNHDTILANTVSNLMFQISNYASSQFKPIAGYGAYTNSGSNKRTLNFFGVTASSSAIDAIRIYTSGGASFNGGTITLFGAS